MDKCGWGLFFALLLLGGCASPQADVNPVDVNNAGNWQKLESEPLEPESNAEATPKPEPVVHVIQGNGNGEPETMESGDATADGTGNDNGSADSTGKPTDAGDGEPVEAGDAGPLEPTNGEVQAVVPEKVPGQIPRMEHPYQEDYEPVIATLRERNNHTAYWKGFKKYCVSWGYLLTSPECDKAWNYFSGWIQDRLEAAAARDNEAAYLKEAKTYCVVKIYNEKFQVDWEQSVEFVEIPECAKALEQIHDEEAANEGD